MIEWSDRTFWLIMAVAVVIILFYTLPEKWGK